MACRFRGWWPFRVGQRRPVLVRDRADKPAQRPRVRGQQHGGHERGDPTRRPPEATALRPAAANKTVITISPLAVPSAGSTYDGSLRAPTHNSGSRRTRPSSQRCASPAPRHRGLKDIRSHRPLTPTFSQDQQHPSAAIRAAARSCGAAAHGFVRLHGLAECPHGGGSSVRVAGWPPQRLEANSPTEQQRANSCDHSADTQLGPHRRWEACRVHRVEVPGPEVLGVATVDNGENWPGLIGQQHVGHGAGDAVPAVLPADDQRGQLPAAVWVSTYLRRTDQLAAAVGDDESFPAKAARVEPSLAHQPNDGGLIFRCGSPDRVLHDHIMAAPRHRRTPAHCITKNRSCRERVVAHPARRTVDPATSLGGRAIVGRRGRLWLDMLSKAIRRHADHLLEVDMLVARADCGGPARGCARSWGPSWVGAANRGAGGQAECAARSVGHAGTGER